jgi:hypothetical protein
MLTDYTRTLYSHTMVKHYSTAHHRERNADGEYNMQTLPWYTYYAPAVLFEAGVSRRIL